MADGFSYTPRQCYPATFQSPYSNDQLTFPLPSVPTFVPPQLLRTTSLPELPPLSTPPRRRLRGPGNFLFKLWT